MPDDDYAHMTGVQAGPAAPHTPCWPVFPCLTRTDSVCGVRGTIRLRMLQDAGAVLRQYEGLTLRQECLPHHTAPLSRSEGLDQMRQTSLLQKIAGVRAQGVAREKDKTR